MIMAKQLGNLSLFNLYVYINNAAEGQKPFDSYAQGTHSARLQAVQAKHDSDEFIRENF